jgi:hypothetical protein
LIASGARRVALLCIVACSPPAPGTVADSTAVAGARVADSTAIPTAADWDAADSATVRLSPTAFPELPAGIVRALLSRNCRVPQLRGVNEPHNVVSGEFARPGQKDWAVLCSRAGHSTLLVFWGAMADSVAELASAPDLISLQGDGKIGFSRRISVVGREYILDHYREYGGPKPPPIDHDGIDDAFVGKASVVRYYYKGEWLTLTGAD